ncbi:MULTISPECIES: hypothetical protein [Pseudanabaena]|uniref:Uncharacterized protein n=2 Tax=Pseudanabaena TaxID=1152 RepID=L8MUD5_9CYAN|nr:MULTISPECIES: hypothetical protein [Pseudanabaena]ELS30389.1 hypothetical protein Pse7429DRAFT_4510 [Pseudanabaena biceps PCC 7429]MDG3497335.1 hypothetical protein [Pseudanabaena catenata USMAC16]TYQ29911.1 hypothetical protein PseudUWO310_11465 [Pseudanabaena sp. UWO310]
MIGHTLVDNLREDFQNVTSTSISTLANIWAKKYIQNLQVDKPKQSIQSNDLGEILSSERRAATAANLLQSLRFSSAQAWAKTETLLMGQLQAHGISADLIDPWQIATDSRFLLDSALKVYTENANNRLLEIDLPEDGQYQRLETYTQLPTVGQLSVAIAQNVGKIRKKYTSVDPRTIGFVSMQFHYSGQMLLNALPPLEKLMVNSYFKVIDDHLYMPLQRCYEAAGDLEYDDIALESVRHLLSLTSEIARQVSQKTLIMHSDYQCYSGVLSSPQIRISSLRDIEMFQVYLCLCVLEKSVSSIQQELFPLCIMLYPPLKVSWELVRTLLRLLSQEMHTHLDERHVKEFEPYLTALNEMFGDDVLPEA